MAAASFVPPSSLSLAERAELFTAGYEDYVVPFALDAERLDFMERAFGTDLGESVVALVDGEAAGLANLATSEGEGWVAGVGVVKARRGTGLGEALMRELLDRARHLGLERVWLEVIVENVAARTLYEKLGFEHVRLLDVWRLPGERGEAPAAPFGAAHDAVRRLRTWREPWQRTDETVERLQEVGPPLQGLAVEDGAAVVRVTDGLVTIVQLAAASEEGRDALVAGARALGETVLLLNLPEDDPAAPALRRAAGEPAIRQHELVLEL